MAISIAEQYPGKTAGTNTDYPQGQARNITTPGDGTGTPWEAAIVNDDQGFKQALLAEAGLVPSGSPDTAVASQYLQALQALFLEKTDITATLAGVGALNIPIGTDFLRIKWGAVDYAGNPGEIGVPVTFPDAFPSTCFVVIATCKMSTHSYRGDGTVLVYNTSRTGFGASLQRFSGGETDELRGFSWIAIGI